MNDLIRNFQIKYPKIVKDMKECNHHYSELALNNFHLEGDVFTHTLLVCKQLELSTKDKVTQIAGLLHDIGKVFTREENHKKGRVSFTNHEKWSAFLSVKFFEDYDLTHEEKQELFELICLHGEPYKIDHTKMNERLIGKNDLNWKLRDFGLADHQGRFYNKENDKHIEYFPSPLEYTKPVESDKEVVFLIGLPGSGKSTYLEQHYKDYFKVSRDDIVIRLSGKKDYDEAWDSVDHKQVNSELEKIFKESLKHEKVVIDMTNLTRKKRIHRLKDYKDYNKKAIVFAPNLITIEERRNKRLNKTISFEVIKDMIESFYPPLHDEGFSNINYIF